LPEVVIQRAGEVHYDERKKNIRRDQMGSSMKARKGGVTLREGAAPG